MAAATPRLALLVLRRSRLRYGVRVDATGDSGRRMDAESTAQLLRPERRRLHAGGGLGPELHRDALWHGFRGRGRRSWYIVRRQTISSKLRKAISAAMRDADILTPSRGRCWARQRGTAAWKRGGSEETARRPARIPIRRSWPSP